jgi:hypothetical protein
MGNCCFQALVHIGLEATNGLLPQWVCAGWMDVWIQVAQSELSESHGISISLGLGQPPAAYDTAVSL